MSIDWEAEFNPRCAVPESAEYSAKSKIKSDQALQKFTDIEERRYGQGPLANFSFRRSSQTHQPLFVFIHGGYWRGRDKSDFGYVFNALEPCDANIAVLNYDLCPQVTVGQIATQIQQAMLWLQANVADLGFDPQRVFLAGHSAGAHLIAMVMAQEPSAFSIADGMVKKAYLISGIYELSPVLKVSVNEEIQLRTEDIHALSPIHFPPSKNTPYEIIVGAAEPPGWVAQSVDFSLYLSEQGAQSNLTILPGRNHYSILQDMEAPDGVLAARFIKDMQGD